MRVHCSMCGEPWDAEYVSQYVIMDTDLEREVAEAWWQAPNRLCKFYRDKLRAIEWQFGQSVFDIRHCPCCKLRRARPFQSVAIIIAWKEFIVELLEYDDDRISKVFDRLHL